MLARAGPGDPVLVDSDQSRWAVASHDGVTDLLDCPASHLTARDCVSATFEVLYCVIEVTRYVKGELDPSKGSLM